MASKPGLLHDWPWERLGSFKFMVIAPWIAGSIQMITKSKKTGEEVDIGYLMILPVMFSRMLHNQIWITISRYQNARSKHRIVDRGLEFEQVDRESHWDDQIILNGIVYYLGYSIFPGTSHLPLWKTSGLIVIALMHTGPVEFLYYWFHRALHHHYLYSRYHSHHHASIITEPITSVVHPFAEHVGYSLLFAIPVLTTILTGTGSLLTTMIYIVYVDFMNNLGHCNVEIIPQWVFRAFPPLKYFMYTPSFHSLHHTQFRTNFCLFMPIYDYLYNTVDKTSDELYEKSRRGREVMPDVIHLTHLTSLQSLFHLRLGITSLSSKPYESSFITKLLWPLSWLSMVLTSLYRSSFIVEKNRLEKLNMQTWAIPRYNFQYRFSWMRKGINGMIENAVQEADKMGVKVLSLGLLNQATEINEGGKQYIEKYPNLKVKIADGSTLAAAVVLNNVPAGTKEVLLCGQLCKVAYAVAKKLCQKGIKVAMANKQNYHLLKASLSTTEDRYLSFSKNYETKVWLVGDKLEESEQRRAPKGAHIIPYSQFPPKQIRKDCLYYITPAMKIPQELENMHCCENWLPRRVMSAWRIAGIIHALEGWEEHECGKTMLDIEKVWPSALKHGFTPVPHA